MQVPCPAFRDRVESNVRNANVARKESRISCMSIYMWMYIYLHKDALERMPKKKNYL